MDVVVVGVDHSSPLGRANWVQEGTGVGAGIDGSPLGGVKHREILFVVAGQHVGLDGTDNSVTTSTTNLGEQEEIGGDGGDILVTNTDLGSDLKGDAEETASHTLKDLREDSLNVGGASATVPDHETDSQHSDASTGDHNPLVVLGAQGDEAGNDAKNGQSQRLGIGEVSGALEVVVHDDHGPVVSRSPGDIEAEEVKEANSGSEVDILVESPTPVEDGLGSNVLPHAEGDEHDTAEDEHGNDPAGRPAVGLELGEVEGEKDEEEATADEEETEGVNVDKEGEEGTEDGHSPVRVDGEQTLGLGPPLVDGEGDDDGEGGDGGADAEEAGTPTPVDGAELGGDLSGCPEVDDVRQTDETDGGTTPLGGDVVGEDDLLHDLNTRVAEGVEDGATGHVGSVLSTGDEDEAENPEEDREAIGLCTTKHVGELGDGELADGDESSLDDGDGGVGGDIFELRGSGILPEPHGVVVETSKVCDESDAEDTDPEGPVCYTATCFSSQDTDLLVGVLVSISMLMRVL